MGLLGLIGWARWIVEGASFVKGRKEGREGGVQLERSRRRRPFPRLARSFSIQIISSTLPSHYYRFTVVWTQLGSYGWSRLVVVSVRGARSPFLVRSLGRPSPLFPLPSTLAPMHSIPPLLLGTGTTVDRLEFWTRVEERRRSFLREGREEEVLSFVEVSSFPPCRSFSPLSLSSSSPPSFC